MNDHIQQIEYIVEMWKDGEIADVEVHTSLREAYAASQAGRNRVISDLIVIVEDGIEIDRYTLIGDSWVDGLPTLRVPVPQIDITIEDILDLRARVIPAEIGTKT